MKAYRPHIRDRKEGPNKVRPTVHIYLTACAPFLDRRNLTNLILVHPESKRHGMEKGRRVTFATVACISAFHTNLRANHKRQPQKRDDPTFGA